MMVHALEAGGRRSVRRLFVTLAVALGAAAIPNSVSALAEPDQAAPAVSVSEARGIYTVAARFTVPETAAAVLAVLTDYERIPRFMPEIVSSVVVERTPDRAVVKQEAVSRFMMFSKRVHLVLDIHEDAAAIRFRDRCGRSFAQYDGGWRIAESNGRTDVVYELIAEPSFDVPDFLLKRLLRRNSIEMIDRLRDEIRSRSTQPHAPSGR
jgi:ribosome-associated toxin RatA of RatAB toxin-antitoxin module